MQPLMGVAEVREFEASLAARGLKAPELMRRAGAVVALQAARLVRGGSVVVLCGMGNNGGDGWVAADELASHGFEVNVVSPATPAMLKSDLARRVAARVADMGIPVHVDPSREELVALLREADVVVDAVFGIGFKGAMPQPYTSWVDAVDEEFDGILVSVDVPSGIDAETGMAEGAYFAADVTVTMLALKPGLISGVGRKAAGQVVVAGLLGDEEGADDVADTASAYTVADEELGDGLPGEDLLQDKYSRGRVLVVAGSQAYPGAAVLCALAAARAGAGYVTLAVPASVVPAVQAHLLTVPVVGLPADDQGTFAAVACDRIEALAAKADVVVAGPGITTGFGACELVRRLLAVDVPLVLDADGLNAAVKACRGSAEANPQPLRREAPLVLTPHARELARLVGAEVSSTATFAGSLRAARRLAWAVGSSNFAVVAKGPRSCVVTTDKVFVPEPGPAALATPGTGDVLAGAVAAFLAQRIAEIRLHGLDTIDAVELLLTVAAADRVHALAGELATQVRGSRAIIATDVIDELGHAFDHLASCAESGLAEMLDAGIGAPDIVPAPDMERVLRADLEAARAGVQLPGEVTAYEGDLEEPEVTPVFTLVPDPVPAEEPADEQPGQDVAQEQPAELDDELEEPAEESDDEGLAGDELDDLEEPAEPEEEPAEEAAEGPVELDDLEEPAEPEEPAEEPEEPAEEPAPVEEPAEKPAPRGFSMPPFLARAVAASTLSGSADPAATTVMPVLDAAEPAEPEELEESAEPQPEPTRSERFHAYATRYVDGDEVTPVDKRPSARRNK